MFCGTGVLVKLDTIDDEVLPLPCNRWSCPDCQPRRRAALLALAASGQPNKLLTLTVTPTIGDSPSDRLTRLHTAWRNLKKRIMRAKGWKNLPYMAFIEATKRGEPHLHILLRCDFIAQKWISNQMREMLSSPIVDIRQIKSTRQAIAYVAKYVSKAPAQFGTHKRYWYSQDYVTGEASFKQEGSDRDYRVSYSRERMEDVIASQRLRGYWPRRQPDGWYRFIHRSVFERDWPSPPTD